MRRLFLLCILCFSFVTIAFTQDQILTATAFFQSLSENYGKISDYEASVAITAGKKAMQAEISFKRPNLLRLDFSEPESQVIVFNGDLLTIYLPEVRAILNQEVTADNSTGAGPTLATPEGLSLMSRYYTIAYEVSRDPVPLEEGSSEMVVNLILQRKSLSEGFFRIKLSVNPDNLLIRRIEALSRQNETFIFDFTDYALNQNIPDTRFIYDAPGSASNYNNFLYTE